MKEITLKTEQEEVYLEKVLAKEYEDPNTSESNRMLAYKILTTLQNE